MNVLIRKQWTEHEKLSYPIIQLPMAITEGGGAAKLFRNRILWYGFIIAAALNVWHGLAHFFPVLPDFSVRHNARNWGHIFLPKKPWERCRWYPCTALPICNWLRIPFTTRSLFFLCGFFYLFEKVQRVAGSALAIPAPFPYGSEQSIGGMDGNLRHCAARNAQGTLQNVARTVFGMSGGIDDSQEPIRYRTALLLIIIAGLFIVWFCFKGWHDAPNYSAFLRVFSLPFP